MFWSVESVGSDGVFGVWLVEAVRWMVFIVLRTDEAVG